VLRVRAAIVIRWHCNASQIVDMLPGGEGPGEEINVRGERYFSAIPYSIYDPATDLQWYWTYQELSVVPTQPVQKGALI